MAVIRLHLEKWDNKRVWYLRNKALLAPAKNAAEKEVNPANVQERIIILDILKKQHFIKE